MTWWSTDEGKCSKDFLAPGQRNWSNLDTDWSGIDGELSTLIGTIVSATSTAQTAHGDLDERKDCAALSWPECTDKIAAAETAIFALQVGIIILDNSLHAHYTELTNVANNEMCTCYRIIQQNINEGGNFEVYDLISAELVQIDDQVNVAQGQVNDLITTGWVLLNQLIQEAEDAVADLEGGC